MVDVITHRMECSIIIIVNSPLIPFLELVWVGVKRLHMWVLILKLLKLFPKALPCDRKSRHCLATLHIDFYVESSPDIEICVNVDQKRPLASAQSIALKIWSFLVKRGKILVYNGRSLFVRQRRMLGIPDAASEGPELEVIPTAIGTSEIGINP